jgi:hypothetical protein
VHLGKQSDLAGNESDAPFVPQYPPLKWNGDRAMDGIIYLVGLIVVVMAILSVLGLR